MAADKPTIENKVRDIASPLLLAEGLELVDVEFVRERDGFILRLFIDKPGGGVGLEDCTKASHAVDTVFDVDELQALGSEQRRGELANLLFDVLFV